MSVSSVVRTASLGLAISLALAAPAAAGSSSAMTSAASSAATTQGVQRQAVAKGLYELAYSPKQDAVRGLVGWVW